MTNKLMYIPNDDEQIYPFSLFKILNLKSLVKSLGIASLNHLIKIWQNYPNPTNKTMFIKLKIEGNTKIWKKKKPPKSRLRALLKPNFLTFTFIIGCCDVWAAVLICTSTTGHTPAAAGRHAAIHHTTTTAKPVPESGTMIFLSKM